MAGLSESELAERAGVAADSVRRIAAAGIVRAAEGGAFQAGDIQRVRLADACERGGIALEDIGHAIRDGALSLAFLDLVFSEPVAHGTQTYADMCAELGLTFELVEAVHEAAGLPKPSPDDRVREDDAEMFPIAQFVLATGMEDESIARVLRVYAENLARVAQAEAQFYHSYIETPMLRSGVGESEMLAMTSQLSPQLRAMVRTMIDWLYRRHQEHSILEHVIEHVELALEEAGVARPRAARPPAMVFLDLVGYTRLTEERGDDVAAELAASLAALVQRESRRFDGRPVKWLGDGVMFHFPEPTNAVLASLEMVERTPQAGLPPAHVGVNAGPVVFRDGDYFGRTVNVAARIAGQAGSGEVLVSEDVASTVRADGVRFDGLGAFDLKNVARPVPLYRARRA